MRAMTWLGDDRFREDELPDPVPGADEVVVRVEAVGVCGTDVHITQGLFPQTPPKVLGHEGAGTIVAVGAGVATGRVGERVVMNTTSHCGVCEACRNWSRSRCEHQRRASGFYAELARLPAQCAIPLPQGMAFELAALTEPASCCLSGVQRLEINREETALVIGGGIMGLLTLVYLKRAGIGTVVLSEPVAGRRAAAQALGADRVHDPMTGPLADVVYEETDGRGVHIAIEAVGKPELVADCVTLTRPRGEVLMIGVCPSGAPLPIDLYDFHFREIRLHGAFGRGDVFEAAVHTLDELPIENLVSERYPLAELPRAIADAARGQGIKLIITPNA